MPKLRLLKTGHGDLCLAEWDVEQPETIATAERSFAENYTGGRMAFRLDGPGLSAPITSFDRFASEIILVPAIQGGSSRSVDVRYDRNPKNLRWIARTRPLLDLNGKALGEGIDTPLECRDVDDEQGAIREAAKATGVQPEYVTLEPAPCCYRAQMAMERVHARRRPSVLDPTDDPFGYSCLCCGDLYYGPGCPRGC